MSKVLYLTGQMSNMPQFNFPLFMAAAAALREQGYTIINPAETDPEDVRQIALQSPDGAYDADGKVGSESWGDMLARDVKMLADGVDVDTEESDADFRARMKTAANEWAALRDDLGPVPAPPPLVRTVTRSQLKIDGIALLPGWEKSRGARLEAFVGLLTGKEYFTVERQAAAAGATAPQSYWLNPVTPEWVQHMLALAWADAIKMHTPIPYAHTIP